MLAANLANFGRIGVIYHKSIEQALVIFPALIAALITVGGGVPADEGGKLDFKVDLGDPPPCSTGFIPPTADPVARRHHAARPADRPVLQDRAERPGRGARRAQLSVPGVPRQAGADRPAVPRPGGYVPIGSNPWRGPPVPYGTPIQRRRETSLPPNKFPNIPPGADYDPGPPSVQLPPGVVPGPGPAPNAPFPLPVPPSDNGPPPPWPFYAPQDQIVPPYARPPAGRARHLPHRWTRRRPPTHRYPRRRHSRRPADPRTATYDPRTGVFVDPAGGSGRSRPGSATQSPAENWVDLMLDPRQA